MSDCMIDDSPEELYLAPICQAVRHETRRWCKDDVWGACEECGAPAVKYLRADKAAEKLYSAAELAALLSVKVRTVHKWREVEGHGPDYVKLGSKARQATIRYRWTDVAAFLERRRRRGGPAARPGR